MASTATPYGLRAVNLIGGQPFAGSTRMFPIASGAAAIYNGDAVAIQSNGTVARETADDAMSVVGVFVGCTYTDPNLNIPVWKQYWPSVAVSGAVAYVVDDPDAVFQVQADGSVAATALGGNAALIDSNPVGSTASGNSYVALDASSVDTTDTLPVRIVGFVQSTTSTPGDAYTDVLVKWNFGMHQYQNATGV